MFSKILALELLEYGIRVNTVALASVKTNFLKNYKDEITLQKMKEGENAKKRKKAKSR